MYFVIVEHMAQLGVADIFKYSGIDLQNVTNKWTRLKAKHQIQTHQMVSPSHYCYTFILHVSKILDYNFAPRTPPILRILDRSSRLDTSQHPASGWVTHNWTLTMTHSRSRTSIPQESKRHSEWRGRWRGRSSTATATAGQARLSALLQGNIGQVCLIRMSQSW